MLERLSKLLSESSSIDEKCQILDSLPEVESFFQKYPFPCLKNLQPDQAIILKQLIAIGQMEQFMGEGHVQEELLSDFLEKLRPVDQFYKEIGGIVGYQAKVLSLLQNKKEDHFPSASSAFHAPSFIDIAEETPKVMDAIDWGIDAMDQMAEIYPLGGAADRLHLVEEHTGKELPAAKLQFAGITLLEHLIYNLQAREYLYFQKHNVQLTTPIAIMTSYEKNNDVHIRQICERLNYFGRPKSSIRFFTQPLVPAFNENGDWHVTAPFTAVLKPGGHGAIWKLARDVGIFSWLESKGRKKALIRQINNPIAGLDYGLLAFCGIGCKKKMVFGFASCPRLLQSAEGVNVLVERQNQIVLTNIEYCDFEKFKIADSPIKEGEPFSKFSSNTNILFADLKAISQAVEKHPFPGLLLNLKPNASLENKNFARLESTMQNIADVFVEPKNDQLTPERTFVTYNKRHKTISTAKKAYEVNKSLRETPENCFYDLLSAHRELLLGCGFQLPEQRTIDAYLKKGPEFLFVYHPGLGPLYAMIRKKLRGGKIALGSDLLVQISDLAVSNLKLQGSLQIISDQIFGPLDDQRTLQFSNCVGTCLLENVQIENEGVDWGSSFPFWKMDLKRKETVQIVLKGNSTFSAKNVTFKGSHTFVVEEGNALRLENKTIA